MSFEPGSTFKIVTYSAGLEEGVFKTTDHFTIQDMQLLMEQEFVIGRLVDMVNKLILR